MPARRVASLPAGSSRCRQIGWPSSGKRDDGKVDVVVVLAGDVVKLSSREIQNENGTSLQAAGQILANPAAPVQLDVNLDLR